MLHVLLNELLERTASRPSGSEDARMAKDLLITIFLSNPQPRASMRFTVRLRGV